MDPLEAGKLLILLAGLAGVYLKLHQAMRAMAGKGTPQEITNNPLNVQETHRAATVEDVGRIDNRVTQLEKRLERHLREVSAEQGELSNGLTEIRDRMDDRFATLGDKMSELHRAVGRLEGH